MATKQYVLKAGQKPTREQIEEVRAAAKRPIVYDDDCPELTEEQLALFYRVSDRDKAEKLKNRKQNVTLRLSPETIEKAKSFGKGYTRILAKIIESTLNDPKLTKMIFEQ